MAELHVVGELLGATGFEDRGLFCKYGIVAGRMWELLEGLDKGQTHVDAPKEGDLVVWSHPIDVHYAVKAVTGWPKIFFQIWSQDQHGRNELRGYGFCHVPTQPGVHRLKCPTWLPEGSVGERLRQFFVGGAPRLTVEDVIHTPGDRFRLYTTAGGLVHLQLSVISKDFKKNNISLG